MKKYVLLIFITLTMILTIVAVGHTKTDGVALVRGVTAEEKTAVERVNYTGSVEYADSTAVTAAGSGVVQSVFAKNGGRVSRGDVILAVCETSADISSSDIMASLTSGGLSSVTDLFGEGASVTVYTAESSGIVSGLDIEPGGFYLKGQTLFTVSEEKAYRVVLNVSEKDIAKVSPGQDVTIDCKALPNVFYGTVLSVSDSARQMSTQTGKLATVRVTVAIENAPNDLRPGYTADCSIITQRRDSVLMVPYSAVITDDDGKGYVYVSKKSGVDKREVVTGSEYSNGVEIKKGLKSGEVVVYDAPRVRDPSKTIIDKIDMTVKG